MDSSAKVLAENYSRVSPSKALSAHNFMGAFTEFSVFVYEFAMPDFS